LILNINKNTSLRRSNDVEVLFEFIFTVNGKTKRLGNLSELKGSLIPNKVFNMNVHIEFL